MKKTDNYFSLMLILGVSQFLAGCLIGLIPHDQVAWHRGIVMAHIEYTANAVLLVVMGFLVREMALGPIALTTWFYSLQLGTWLNGVAGVVAAFSGNTSPLLYSVNTLFPPPNGTDNPVVTGLLMTVGITILIGLVLTLAGLIRGRKKYALAAVA